VCGIVVFGLRYVGIVLVGLQYMLDSYAFLPLVFVAYHIRFHPVNKVSYCAVFMFVWMTRILWNNMVGGGWFSVDIKCELFFISGDSDVHIM
jgi:hypothetical protein